MTERQPSPKMSKARKFLYNHGRTAADVASYSRLAIAAATAGFLLADKPQAAHRAHLFGMASDKADGTLAGLSKEGPTKAGGQLDQRIDKIFTATPEVVLATQGELKARHPILRVARDIVMTGVRAHFDSKGVDTKALQSGKYSTAAVLIADSLSMTEYGRKHPKLTETVHTVATGLKWYSLFDSYRVWNNRLQEKSGGSRAEETIYTAKAA